MAPLRLLGAATVAMLMTPARAETIADWRAPIAEASARFGVPTNWIEGVMRAESGGQTMRGGRPIRSRAGAMGLMQLMPATWASLRTALHLGTDPDDPRDNIIAGAAFLRQLYDRFGYPGLFAAYNAGPARYADHLATGRPLPAETTAYLGKVEDRSADGERTAIERPHEALFAVRHGDPLLLPGTVDQPLPALFVVKK